jgi:Flp pilus assembly pilin Flp
MRRKHGSNISQYAIIIALIALALTPIFFLLGQNVTNFFSSFSAGMSGDTTLPAFTIPANAPQINAGDQSGTPDNPVKNCDNGYCSIDYGTFALNGIPENFSEVVQTSGTSGGTEQLVSLIEQIASQLASEGKKDDAVEIQKLANLGHDVAIFEKAFENLAETCDYEPSCLNTYYDKPFPRPDNLNNVDNYYKETTYYDILHSTDLINAYKYYTTGAGQEKWYKDNVSSSFIQQYQTVMKEDSISEPVRGVLEQLVLSIAETGQGFHMALDDNTSAEAIQNYNASQVTHIDSALICGAGWKEDTGTSCQ